MIGFPKWSLLCALGLATFACGDSGEGGGGAGGTGGEPAEGGGGAGGTVAPNPIEQFYLDFQASRFSRADEVAAALDAELEQNPNATEASTVRALAHLWHIAEIGRDPSQQGSIFAEQVALMSQFQQAKTNNPNDPRVNCWLGLVEITTGQATQNQALITQGYATIEAGVAAYPEFNLFCKALAYEAFPASDPNFQQAIDALYKTMDECFGETVDRANPDITDYLGQATSTGPKRVCWNDPIAPHNAEGFYLYFGDMLVKAGEVAAATVAYNNAKLVAEYDDWPYKSLLESRLEADLPARAALYADSDATNDPPIAGAEIHRSCTYCHASSAAE